MFLPIKRTSEDVVPEKCADILTKGWRILILICPVSTKILAVLSLKPLFQHRRTNVVFVERKHWNFSPDQELQASCLSQNLWISSESANIRPNSVHKSTIGERASNCGCVAVPALIYIFHRTVTVAKALKKKKEAQNMFYFFSFASLSFYHPTPPSLPSPPLSHLSSAPRLACPAIAPLLCGLSFVSPAGYSFVPPSSAPFWSGTGIASLCLSLLTLSFLFRVDGCLACRL